MATSTDARHQLKSSTFGLLTKAKLKPSKAKRRLGAGKTPAPLNPPPTKGTGSKRPIVNGPPTLPETNAQSPHRSQGTGSAIQTRDKQNFSTQAKYGASSVPSTNKKLQPKVVSRTKLAKVASESDGGMRSMIRDH